MTLCWCFCQRYFDYFSFVLSREKGRPTKWLFSHPDSDNYVDANRVCDRHIANICFINMAVGYTVLCSSSKEHLNIIQPAIYVAVYLSHVLDGQLLNG